MVLTQELVSMVGMPLLGFPIPALSFAALFPQSGLAFLSLSLLVSHQAEGRQNQGGVGSGRGGEKRLKLQVKERSGKGHTPTSGKHLDTSSLLKM